MSLRQTQLAIALRMMTRSPMARESVAEIGSRPPLAHDWKPIKLGRVEKLPKDLPVARVTKYMFNNT
eukprot:4155177-Pyramimonas_sp.AAC.1